MHLRPAFQPEQRDQPTLVIDIDHRADPATQRITVGGELDAPNAAELHQAVIDVLRRHRPTRIEIDLRRATFLDSAGIRALLQCHRDADGVECRLTVTDPHPMAYRVLQITGLLDHFGLTNAPTAPVMTAPSAVSAPRGSARCQGDIRS